MIMPFGSIQTGGPDPAPSGGSQRRKRKAGGAPAYARQFGLARGYDQEAERGRTGKAPLNAPEGGRLSSHRPFGSSQSASGGGFGGGFGGPGGGQPGGFGGMGGFQSSSGFGSGTGPGGGWQGQPVEVKSEQSPHLAEMQKRWEAQQAAIMEQANKVDENLQSQIELYKERMGEGPTTRAIERASSQVRDFAAGQAQDAMTAGAAGGRGQGFGATGIAESAQRAQAGAAADISLGRERDLDRLLMSGQRTMEAPGARQMGYYGMGSNFFGQSPYGMQANYMLGSQGLGLEAAGLGLQAQQAQQGNAQNWFNMLFPGGLG